MATVMHCVGGLNSGGTENWLINSLRELSGEHNFTFVVHATVRYPLTESATALGANVVVCEGLPNWIAYAMNFWRLLRDQKPDVVHIHLDMFSLCPLIVAFISRIRVRIVHSHTDTSRNDGLLRRCLRRFNSWPLRVFATELVACSTTAALSLFGRTDEITIMHCGVPVEKWGDYVSSTPNRTALGLGENDLVIANIGRCTGLKNQVFLIDMLATCFPEERTTKLLILGEGPEQKTLRDRVVASGLSGRCVFVPYHPRPQSLLRGLVDVFVFPSLYEGLGLALIDAQAADVPCVISEFIPEEAVVCDELCYRVPLSHGPKAWAACIQRLVAEGPRNRDAVVGHNAILRSDFNITESASNLAGLYC